MKRTTFKGQHMSWFPWPKRLKGKSHTFTITIEDPAMWEYEFKKVREPLPEGEEYWEPAFPDKPETHDHIKMLTTTRDVINPNQLDWNKLIGIKKNLFSPRKNSVMLGWRWNPIDNCLELCPYWHDENGGNWYYEKYEDTLDEGDIFEPVRISKNQLELIQSVQVDFFYVEDFPSVCISVVLQEPEGRIDLIDEVYLLPNNAYIGTGWMISPWFGGQETALHKIIWTIVYGR